MDEVTETADGDLSITLGGRTYVVEDVDMAVGERCERIFAQAMTAKRRLDAGEDADDIRADLVLSDDDEDDLYRQILGDVHAQMEADGVKHRRAKLVGSTAYVWIVHGLAAAQKFWVAGGAPDPKPNRETRRASGTRAKASGAAASTTKARASGSGTRTTRSRSRRS